MDHITSKIEEHKRIVMFAKNEIAARLENIGKNYRKYDIPELCAEMDKIRDRVIEIKRSLIFVKNIFEPESKPRPPTF